MTQMQTSWDRLQALRTDRQAQQVFALATDYGWDVRPLGVAPPLEEPVRVGDFLLVPAQMDRSPVPQRAMDRIQQVYAAGIMPKGWIVAHEAPMLLPAPKSDPPPKVDHWARVREHAATIGRTALKVGIASLPVMVGAAKVVGIACFAALRITLGLLLAIGLDPVLILVTQDDHWIEIDRWDSVEAS